MLSEAKHLVADRDRPFASLRVTLCNRSNCQGLCFTIEPFLSIMIHRLMNIMILRLDRKVKRVVELVIRGLDA